jgi:hypothetical protein
MQPFITLGEPDDVAFFEDRPNRSRWLGVIDNPAFFAPGGMGIANASERASCIFTARPMRATPIWNLTMTAVRAGR